MTRCAKSGNRHTANWWKDERSRPARFSRRRSLRGCGRLACANVQQSLLRFCSKAGQWPANGTPATPHRRE